MEILDQVFDILSEERRRYVLYYLEQENEPVSVDELATQVAEWETDGPPESIPDGKFEQIEVELCHLDVPEAAEEPYVRYNPETKMVELSGAPPEVDAIIHVAKVIERPGRNP